MNGKSYIVTEPDGRRQLFANVKNSVSFLAAMAASGKPVVEASKNELEEAGFGSNFSHTASFCVLPLPPSKGKQAAAPTASVHSPKGGRRRNDTSPLADAVARVNARGKRLKPSENPSGSAEQSPNRRRLSALMDEMRKERGWDAPSSGVRKKRQP